MKRLIIIALILVSCTPVIYASDGQFLPLVTDFEVINVSVQPYVVLPGSDVTISVFIRNNAPIPFSPPIGISAKMFVKDNLDNKLISDQNIPQINPGETIKLDFRYSSTTPGSHQIYAYADYADDVKEINEYDNSATETFIVRTPPVLDVSHSPENPTIDTLVTIHASVYDPERFTRYVKFYVDGVQVGPNCFANYFTREITYNCDSPANLYVEGTHTYWIEGIDIFGLNYISAKKNFFVGPGRNNAPTAFSYPPERVMYFDGIRFVPTNNFTFNVWGRDIDGFVRSIILKIDNVSAASCASEGDLSYLECSFRVGPLSSGVHSYEVLAYDNRDGVGSTGVKTFNV
jgi:hypothetical protein